MTFYKITFTGSLAGPSPAVAAGQLRSVATEPRPQCGREEPMILGAVDKNPHVSTGKTEGATDTLSR